MADRPTLTRAAVKEIAPDIGRNASVICRAMNQLGEANYDLIFNLAEHRRSGSLKGFRADRHSANETRVRIGVHGRRLSLPRAMSWFYRGRNGDFF